MTGCWGCAIDPAGRWRCLDRSMGRMDRHHLVPRQTLRREFPYGVALADGRWKRAPSCFTPVEGARVRSLAELLADPRNLITMGRWHHAQFENHMLNPSWQDLPDAAVEFAGELGLGHLLERRYPMRAAA